MAKDPAFLFYPGDYLRDTQCLSEAVQVAYDRIMCEHMRNICITKEQLNFFTKRLNEAEKAELMYVLKKVDGGYQIGWVAESISKRKSYSESRRQNRKGKSKNISSSYHSHMEDEDENEIVNNPSTVNAETKSSEKKEKEFLNNTIWIESFSAANNLSISQAKNIMERFVADMKSRGRNVQNYPSYFLKCWQAGDISVNVQSKSKLPFPL